ncbi:hypothetical protein [Romboutsia sp.]|uniref:hypothetical protein n=1 Tax=Romboutsia sp. TaxID=1965302 RepID=UPI003F3EBE63
MGRLIFLAGFSGTGKTTGLGANEKLGIKGLDPTKTAVINVTGQPLPFPKWKSMYSGALDNKGNYFESSNPKFIQTAIGFISKSRPDIKNIFIDDGQFILSLNLMAKATEKGYEKYTEIGMNITNILKEIQSSRPDINCYITWHPEETKNGLKLKTIGNMLDNWLTLEGLTNIFLYSEVIKDSSGKPQYRIVTRNDGNYPAKSPYGMFENVYIPNDLFIIEQALEAYEN